MRNTTIVLAVLALASTAWGANVDWAGGTSTDWTDGANWGGGVAPGAADKGRILVAGTYAPHILNGKTVTQQAGILINNVGRTLYVDAGGTLNVESNTTSAMYLDVSGTYDNVTGPDLSKAAYLIQTGGLIKETAGTGGGCWLSLGISSWKTGVYRIEGGTLDMDKRGVYAGRSDGNGKGRMEIAGGAPVKIEMAYFWLYTGSELQLEFDGDSDPIQEIVVTSTNIKIAGSILNVTGTAPNGTYSILDYTGTLTETFGTVNLPSSDWSINYNDGGKVTLTVIPEPATMVLLGIGGIGVLIRRRRK